MSQEVQADRRLSRRQRLRRSRDFQEAYEQGRRYVGRLMTLWLRTSPEAALRLGVTAGRKVGQATVRARAKRLLREAYRANRFRFSGAYDVVLTARYQIVTAGMRNVEAELLLLAKKAGILRER